MCGTGGSINPHPKAAICTSASPDQSLFHRFCQVKLVGFALAEMQLYKQKRAARLNMINLQDVWMISHARCAGTNSLVTLNPPPVSRTVPNKDAATGSGTASRTGIDLELGLAEGVTLGQVLSRCRRVGHGHGPGPKCSMISGQFWTVHNQTGQQI